jgi:hypothetical protein
VTAHGRVGGCQPGCQSRGPHGVDLSVTLSVPEAEDGLMRVTYAGKGLTELMPPWIEARRRGIALDLETDSRERRRFDDGMVWGPGGGDARHQAPAHQLVGTHRYLERRARWVERF